MDHILFFIQNVLPVPAKAGSVNELLFFSLFLFFSFLFVPYFNRKQLVLLKEVPFSPKNRVYNMTIRNIYLVFKYRYKRVLKNSKNIPAFLKAVSTKQECLQSGYYKLTSYLTIKGLSALRFR